LADRDAREILKHGSRLLEYHPEFPSAIRGQVLGATMLAAIASDERGEAQAAWDTYGGPVFGGAPLPAYIRLLRSIAAVTDEGRQVATAQ
jgi:hypothetical protein